MGSYILDSWKGINFNKEQLKYIPIIAYNLEKKFVMSVLLKM